MGVDCGRHPLVCESRAAMTWRETRAVESIEPRHHGAKVRSRFGLLERPAGWPTLLEAVTSKQSRRFRARFPTVKTSTSVARGPAPPQDQGCRRKQDGQQERYDEDRRAQREIEELGADGVSPRERVVDG
ncbi:MAG: hypothetical protein JWM82_1872 [Myxococcales bacterium]|nr:hypothetical protein [Myxococcales bacterium]